jgi:hypothetical protein
VPALYFAEQDQQRDNLTPEEAHYIYQTTCELVDNLGAAQAAPSAVAEPIVPEEDPAPALAPKIRLLGCPAHDEADEVAFRMFQQVLDPARFEVHILKVTLLIAEVIAEVEQIAPSIVCIGFVPPGGFAQTRYLCKRLRAKFPTLPLVVGCWGCPKDEEEHLVRLRLDSIVSGGTTLLETRALIMQLPQSQIPAVVPAVSSVA